MSFVSIWSSYSWDLCLVVSLPVPDRFSSSVPTGFILAVLSLLLSFLQSIASMLSYSSVRALETKHFSRCGIKARLIYFALNVILTFHLFVYHSKWTQTTDLCVSWKTILIQFIEINWKHYRDASFNLWPEIKMKLSAYWLIKRRHL